MPETDAATATASKTDSKLKGVQRDALNALARLGGAVFAEDDVVFEGKRLVIPENMSLGDAESFLARKRVEEEEVTAFSRTFKYRPWDGAAAMQRTLKRNFGSVYHGGGKASFFGGPPPKLIDISSGPNETIQVPWGSFVIPFMAQVIFYLGQTEDPDNGLVFQITAEGPKKYRHHVEGLFKLIQDELETESIYRGGAFDGSTMPQFIDPWKVPKESIVFSESTAAQIEANIIAPIRFPDLLSEMGVSGKRAVLLHGPYGTGKTSAGMLIAQEAQSQGWTFVYARPEHDLIDVMRTARLYEPAVVFFEDLDKLTEGTDRDSVSELLDLFDGIASKDARILAVLTTNHPDQIHKGMIRPGRLDAVIEIGTPDANGIEAIIRAAIPERMLNGVDWNEVSLANAEYLPAFIREAADRAIRYAVLRNNGDLTEAVLTTEDLVFAADGLRPQWELMQDAPEMRELPTLDTAVSETVKRQVEEGTRKILDALEYATE